MSYVNSVEVCRGLSRVCRASVEFYVEVSRPGAGLWPRPRGVARTRFDFRVPLAAPARRQRRAVRQLLSFGRLTKSGLTLTVDPRMRV